jgi:hypothetical protein
MAKKNKLEELSETNAKVEDFKPTSLDQIWGDRGTSKYGTLDPEKYAEKLRGLNKTDLFAHARSIGIMPNDNYDLLLRKLKEEFLAHINAYRRPSSNTTVAGAKKISPQVLKILSEGR